MKKMKKVLALLLAVCMLAGMTVNAAPASEESEQTSTSATDSEFDKILHLDNGRKYFTKEWIIALINEMSEAGYNQLQLAFGNDGLRFLLDDMSVTVDGTTYSSEDVTAGIKQGNENYYDAGEVNELTQSEMTEIVNYAKSKGIEIVPHMNMPGHMDAILDAIEYVGIDDAHFTGYTTSARSLNLNNDAAVNFTHALLEKYVAYFADLGCEYFHIGADEFGNDAYSGSMGFPNMGSTLYAKFEDFVDESADIVKDAGMTPRAWNDGISYTKYSSSFDKDIQITYWSSGWNGYDVASASTLRSNGHEMINTHGDYYFVLTSSGITNPSDKALDFSNTSFMGSTVSDPVGSMFCIWCDDPDSATEQEVAEAVRITLRKMAASMNNTDEYSEEVVSGGFNEDGTIADSRNWNTVTSSDDNKLQVSGNDLTTVETVEVTGTDLPSIEKAGNIKAWDITPYVGTDKYTEKGVVSLPVPAEWNTSRLTGFYVEDGNAVLVEGAYKDGYYTFEMPHFSVAGIAEVKYDKLIELNVGESKVETDSTGNYEDSYTEEGLNKSIATVSVEGVAGGSKGTIGEAVTSITEGKYVIYTYLGAYVANGADGNYIDLSTEQTVWNVKVADATAGTYYITDSEGKYLTVGSGTAGVTTTQTAVKLVYGTSTDTPGQSGFFIQNSAGTYNLNNSGETDNAYGKSGAAGSWSRWQFKSYTESSVADSTEITFTGVSVGETFVTVGGTVYKIVVNRATITSEIAIDNYKTYEDTSTEIISNTDPSVATATLSEGVLTITGLKVGETVITTTNAVYNITVSEVDLSDVEPLKIEYWITNGVVKDPSTGLNYIEISAEDAYSEDGIVLADTLPEVLQRDGRNTEYWQAKLLDVTVTNESTSGTEEQTLYEGDDETLNTKTFTRVRFWNNEWQVLVGTEWTTVDRTEVTVNAYSNNALTGTTTRETNQLVAYYMEVIDIYNDNGTTELYVNAADWGFKSGENWGYGTNSYTPCTVTVQIVYEDGTTNPGDDLDDLLTKTLVYSYWSGGRGLGTMIFDGGDSYDIYKVTAETGDAEYTNTSYGFTIDDLSWDGNEETVWSDDPSQSVSIGNPARNPSYEAPKDNLTWNTGAYNENNAILVRVYVKAVETEDTLNVVYYDEKFGDTLYSYNINVNSGVNFNDNIVNLTTDKVEDPGYYVDADGNTTTRYNVTGYGIHNALDVVQKFQTDLTQVPEAVGKYNNALYRYTGSVISEDGKTLYLYYNIDTEVLSPMFVIDYGNPFTFELSKVVNADKITMVKDVTVNENTRYGTLKYDADKKIFTYTPTQVLPNIDVLTINITFDGESAATTTNAGVMPATTVDYEEGFAALNGFTGGSTGTSMQTAQVAGQSTDEYGYDSNIVKDANTKAVSEAKGNTATFAFTGTGVDLYVNSAETSGNIAVQVRDAATNKLVKVISVKTTSNSTITGDFSNTDQKGLIAASVTGLDYGQYTVKVTTTNAEKVYFDGFRVYGTLQDQVNNESYIADLEDNPTFLELRDYVLTAMNVTNSDSASVYAQIREATDGALTGVLLSNSDSYDGEELLENGPKNELFLLPGQTVVFKITTDREVQVGMKAVNGTAIVKGTYGGDDGEEITSERDMFYTVIQKDGNAKATEKTVTITNDSESKAILSITKIKICDDPNVTFGELEAEDLVDALETLGFKEETPSEPEVEYADASLTINLTDDSGEVIASTSLTANGVVGESATFTAADIKSAVESLELPAGYKLKKASYSDKTVAYGEEDSVTFTAEKKKDTTNILNQLKNMFSNLKDKLSSLLNKNNNVQRSVVNSESIKSKKAKAAEEATAAKTTAPGNETSEKVEAIEETAEVAESTDVETEVTADNAENVSDNVVTDSEENVSEETQEETAETTNIFVKIIEWGRQLLAKIFG